MIVKVIVDYEKSVWEKGSIEFFTEYEKIDELKDFVCQELQKLGLYVLGCSKLVAPESAVISTQENLLEVLKKISV